MSAAARGLARHVVEIDRTLAPSPDLGVDRFRLVRNVTAEVIDPAADPLCPVGSGTKGTKGTMEMETMTV